MGNSSSYTVISDPLNDVHSLTILFQEAETPEIKSEVVNKICDLFTDIFVNFEPKLELSQKAALKEGLVELMGQYYVACLALNQEQVLHCMKWFCVNNREVCLAVYKNQVVFESVIRSLQHCAQNPSQKTINRDVAALRLVNSVMKMIPEDRRIVTKFLPVLSQILSNDKVHDHIKAQAVNFFFLASCDDSTHQSIRSIVPHLTALVKAANWEANYFSAALAIINLSSNDMSVLSELEWDHVINNIYDALELSMLGLDFPRGSRRYYTDWLLLVSIITICKTTKLRTIVKNTNFYPLGQKIISQYPPQSDNLLYRYALILLSYLERDEFDETIKPLTASKINPQDIYFQTPSMEGYLYKSSTFGWKKYYFCLTGSVIKYWVNLETAKENLFVNPRQRVLIESVGKVEQNNRQFVLKGMTYHPIEYILYADTEELREKWLNVIKLGVLKRNESQGQGQKLIQDEQWNGKYEQDEEDDDNELKSIPLNASIINSLNNKKGPPNNLDSLHDAFM
eukprot:c20788_g1_i1.p1 GENE.c20788_g1_i1~~c20788_g1_i1.p1  ORF type:complete len:511 (+),score=168.09 c20788_g1_i1:1042-2574(+)